MATATMFRTPVDTPSAPAGGWQHIRNDEGDALCNPSVPFYMTLSNCSVQPSNRQDSYEWSEDRLAKQFVCPSCLELRPDCNRMRKQAGLTAGVADADPRRNRAGNAADRVGSPGLLYCPKKTISEDIMATATATPTTRRFRVPFPRDNAGYVDVETAMTRLSNVDRVTMDVLEALGCGIDIDTIGRRNLEHPLMLTYAELCNKATFLDARLKIAEMFRDKARKSRARDATDKVQAWQVEADETQVVLDTVADAKVVAEKIVRDFLSEQQAKNVDVGGDGITDRQCDYLTALVDGAAKGGRPWGMIREWWAFTANMETPALDTLTKRQASDMITGLRGFVRLGGKRRSK